MKKYNSYKDSGIEWIGEIPSHWEVLKLRMIGNFSSSGIDKKINKKEPEVKIINYTDVYGNKAFTLDSSIDYMRVTAPQSKIKEHIVKKGDLIFTPSSETKEDIGLSALIREELHNTAFSYHVLRFQFNKDVDLNFKKYLCNNNYVLNYFSQNSRGTTRQTLGRDDFNSAQVLLPPINEQAAIANYLDKKTAEIDELITDKEELLKLYAEEKTAVINQAVTKGIDSDVKMKDSGIEWLGEIPEHWEKKRLRYLCKITTGDKDTVDREDEGKYPFFVRSQTIEKISTYTFDGEGVLTAGDGVGVCKVWHYINGKFDFHQRVYLLYDFQGLLGSFLFNFIKENFIHDVLKLSAKSTVDSLRRNMFLEFPVAYPKVKEEQQSIVNYIEAESNRIDTKIENTRKLIELLKEYREALISEVVTGKVKVV